MPAPQFILLLERALAAYLPAAETPADFAALPAGFPIYCAHEGALIPDATIDFLVIQAGRPGGELMAAGNMESLVELQLFTGALASEGDRPGAIVLHDDRAALLEWILGPDNFEAALRALNAPILAGIGFSGWARPDDAPGEDGRTERGQLLAKVRYEFVVHRI